MYSPFLKRCSSVSCCCPGAAVRAQSGELRVCADPNNMPFSNLQQRVRKSHRGVGRGEIWAHDSSTSGKGWAAALFANIWINRNATL